MMDLQSIGRQLAWLRKENQRLQDIVTELQIINDGLKLTIEEILLSPGEYHYQSGKHPMYDDR